MNDLNITLNDLCNSSRQLNSSFHVTRAAMQLEKSQREVVAIFRRVATLLFPTEAPKETQEADDTGQMPATSPKAVQGDSSYLKRISRTLLSRAHEESGQQDNKYKDIEDIHIRFEDWAEHIEEFTDSINKLPGHTDKDISNRMGLLATDLRVPLFTVIANEISDITSLVLGFVSRRICRAAWVCLRMT